MYYQQHYGLYGDYFNPCDRDYEEKYIINVALCEAETLFDISLAILVATQCCFVVCLLIYKSQEFKRYDGCGDMWCVFIYIQIVISSVYALVMWFYIASLV